MNAVIESLSGTVNQVVIFKSRVKAVECFKKFCKQNNVSLEREMIINSLAYDDNGYEVAILPVVIGD